MKLLAASMNSSKQKMLNVDVPLINIRPVKKVALVVVTGERSLYGGFNHSILRKAEQRIKALKTLGLSDTVISVGKKGNSCFIRRPYFPVDKFLAGGGDLPIAQEAQATKLSFYE